MTAVDWDLVSPNPNFAGLSIPIDAYRRALAQLGKLQAVIDNIEADQTGAATSDWLSNARVFPGGPIALMTAATLGDAFDMTVLFRLARSLA